MPLNQAREVRKLLAKARLTHVDFETRDKLVEEFKAGLARDGIDFFNRLPNPFSSDKLRIFERFGHQVVVKTSEGNAFKQGLLPGNYLRFMRSYRAAIKAGEINPKSYVLVKIRPLADFYEDRIRQNFLVMEHLNKDKSESFHESLKELSDDMRTMHRKHDWLPPQSFHALPLGFIGEGKNKKAVLAPPHDYR